METFTNVFILCCVLTLNHFARAHIVLTYPPARGYPLDFLDNIRTPDPCGMPKGTASTDLKADSTYKITWSQAYPHKGDYSIELLDANEKVKSVLKPFTSPSNETETAFATILEHELKLPATECINCAIRLRRQALEWSSPLCGMSYEFRSCSDVNIRTSVTDEKKCTSSSRGTFNAGTAACTCKDKYYGPACQYEYECKAASDCNNNGECVTINAMSTYQPKQCFCNAGFMGKNCEKVSPVKQKITDFSSYKRETMHTAPTFDVFYKILTDSNEVEMIVRAYTDSWVAVGWRPAGYMSGCQAFPTLKFPTADPSVTTVAPPPVTTQAGCKPEPEGSPEAEPETIKEPNGEDYTVPTTGAKPHPMDCSDIVIGAVRDNRFSIGDYYTRDRSRPLRDSVYGGEDSLTAAFGYVENRETYIVFRKPLNATHRTDNSITEDRLNFIWARGQKNRRLSHKPDAGVSQSSDYYKDDELKYHGTNEQRGHTTLQMMGGDDSAKTYSSGSFTSNDANVMVDWHYLDDSQSVEFIIKYINYDTSKWFGLGFSKDRSMVKSDAIVVSSSSDGKTVVTDRWMSAKSRPPVDVQDDVKVIISANTDGTFYITLHRKADTGDDKDIQFGSKDDCVYFFLARGNKQGNGPEISKHSDVEISPKKYCIASDRVVSDKDDDGLTTLEKIIIGVTAAVVAFCIILGMVLCIRHTLDKGHEKDERKYRDGSEYSGSINKETVSYTNTRPDRPISDMSTSTYVNKGYESYGNKPIDVVIADSDQMGYSDWVSKVYRGGPAY